MIKIKRNECLISAANLKILILIHHKGHYNKIISDLSTNKKSGAADNGTYKQLRNSL